MDLTLKIIIAFVMIFLVSLVWDSYQELVHYNENLCEALDGYYYIENNTELCSVTSYYITTVYDFNNISELIRRPKRIITFSTS